MRLLALASPLCFAIWSVHATATETAADEQKRFSPADIAALPTVGAGAGTSGIAGIRTTILAGDPNANGPYTIMLRVPPNTSIAAHRHKDSRSAIVVSGTWRFGYGTRANADASKALGPGSFYTEPADVAHFASTGDEPVVLYITGSGPTDTRYVEMADDPRRN